MNLTTTRRMQGQVVFVNGPAAKIPLGILGHEPSIASVAAAIAHLTPGTEPGAAGEYRLTWGHDDGGWIGVEHITEGDSL